MLELYVCVAPPYIGDCMRCASIWCLIFVLRSLPIHWPLPLQIILEAHCLDTVNIPSVMIKARKGSMLRDIGQMINDALRASGYTGGGEVDMAKVMLTLFYFLDCG